MVGCWFVWIHSLAFSGEESQQTASTNQNPKKCETDFLLVFSSLRIRVSALACSSPWTAHVMCVCMFLNLFCFFLCIKCVLQWSNLYAKCGILSSFELLTRARIKKLWAKRCSLLMESQFTIVSLWLWLASLCSSLWNGTMASNTIIIEIFVCVPYLNLLQQQAKPANLYILLCSSWRDCTTYITCIECFEFLHWICANFSTFHHAIPSKWNVSIST